MASLPQVVLDAWNNRIEPFVFTTASATGVANSVYVTWAKPIDRDRFLIVNNRFHKTLENINAGSLGSFLFITKDGESFQMKGSLEYFTHGKIHDEMKAWLDPKFPGLGAVVMSIEEVYRGAEDLLRTNDQS